MDHLVVAALYNVGYAEFWRNDYVKSNTVRENNHQLQELKDEIVEENHKSQNNYPKTRTMPIPIQKQYQ